MVHALSDRPQFLEQVLEEAFRRHPSDLQRFLWHLCEESNMPRVRARYICAQLAAAARKQP